MLFGSAVRRSISQNRPKIQLDWRDSTPSFGEGISYLFETGLYSDVIFKVGPDASTFNAHTLILKMRSEVFSVKFNSVWSAESKDNPEEEEKRVVNILDKSPQSFKHFLKYLYTDEFSEEIGVSEALDVLDLAHLYQVPGLLCKCSEFLMIKINVDSCVEIFQRTRLYSELYLSPHAFKFINKNISLVASNDQFLHLNLAEIINLLESDDLAIDELRLFRALLRWGNGEGVEKDHNGDSRSRKEALKLLTPYIRFLLISPENFAKEVVPAKVLSDEETVKIFCYFNGGVEKNEKLEIWSKLRQPEVPYQDEIKCFPIDVQCLGNYCEKLELFRIYSLTLKFGQQKLNPQFRFRCVSPVLIRGLRFYGINESINTRLFKYHVQFTISTPDLPLTCITNGDTVSGGKNVCCTSQLITLTEFGNFDVLLEKPFQTEVNQAYWISASIALENDRGHAQDYRVTHGVRKQKEDVFAKVKSKCEVSFEICHNKLCLPFNNNCGGRNSVNKFESEVGLEFNENNMEFGSSGRSVTIGIVHSILFNHV